MARSRAALLVYLIAPVILFASACGSSGGNTSSSAAGTTGATEIPIAELEALTGAFSTYGKDTAQGAALAVSQINNAGGFEVSGKKYKFDLTQTDVQSDPTVAAEDAQQVLQSSTQFIIGATVSDLATPLMTDSLRYKDKLILTAATAAENFVGPGKLIFQTRVSDPVSGPVFIPNALKQFPGVKKFAVLEDNDAAGALELKVFLPILKQNGAQIVSEQTFPSTQTDFGPLIQSIPADVQAIYMGYNPTNTLAIMNAAIEDNRKFVFIDQGAGCQNGSALAGKIEGYVCPVYTEDPSHPSSEQAAAYFKAYEQKYGPTNASAAYSLYTYDYVYALTKAMQKAGSVDNVPAIAAALRGLTYNGVTEVKFNADGINISPVKLGVAKDGKYQIVDPSS